MFRHLLYSRLIKPIGFIDFFIGWRSTGQFLRPVSVPQRSTQRSNDTEGDIKWEGTHEELNTVKILIIASCFFLKNVCCLCMFSDAGVFVQLFLSKLTSSLWGLVVLLSCLSCYRRYHHSGTVFAPIFPCHIGMCDMKCFKAAFPTWVRLLCFVIPAVTGERYSLWAWIHVSTTDKMSLHAGGCCSWLLLVLISATLMFVCLFVGLRSSDHVLYRSIKTGNQQLMHTDIMWWNMKNMNTSLNMI